jgi:geranyl-CoA carboxylase beta subunit
MTRIASTIDVAGEAFLANRAALLERIDAMRALERRTRERSAASKPAFEKRGQLLPRERLALLLDPGAPFLELSALAGHARGESAPGGGFIAGVGHVSGVRAMIVVDDSGIDAGAVQPMGVEKFLRAQTIALAQKLPFVHLVESAGANLLEYKVETFIHGGGIFHRLAKLSAAGLPVITVVHGPSTAGGAYMTGLSDYIVMVRDRAKAFLAGPPLLKAATGEVATEEELGGAAMHAQVSGLAEYVGADDAEAIGIARAIAAALDWNRDVPPRVRSYEPPALDAEELLGIAPVDLRKPLDMRQVVARIVDDSAFLEFKSAYGPATVCGHAAICGTRIGILTNNRPLDPAGANKATHFIQLCVQADIPLVYLMHTTGFIVGKESERAGMIKHGSKMIQAMSNAAVPRITIHCGAAFGAGNYGMSGRGFEPDFCFSWPNARTAVMGAEQAAGTMAQVMEGAMLRKTGAVDRAAIDAMRAKVIETFERQADAFYTSGLLLDDGVIDPRDTRAVLAICLSVCDEARRRAVRGVQFGAARP